MQKTRYLQHKNKRTGQISYIRNKNLAVEVKVLNQVIVFKMPGKVALRMIDALTRKYMYVYFIDRHFNGDLILRPPWEIKEIPIKPAKKLQYFRAEQGLTQTGLAEMTGMTQANISSMESGKRLIGKNVAKRLGDALDIDYRVFL